MSLSEEREYFLQEITTPEGQKKLIELIDELVPLIPRVPIPEKHKILNRLMDLLEIAYFNAHDLKFLNQSALRITTFLSEAPKDDLITKSYLMRLLQYLPAKAEIIAFKQVEIFEEAFQSNIAWYEGIAARIAYFIGRDMPEPAQDKIYSAALKTFSKEFPAWRKEPLILLLASLFNKKRKEGVEIISSSLRQLLKEPGKRGRNALWASILMLRQKDEVGKWLDEFVPIALKRVTKEKSSEFAGMMLIELNKFPDNSLIDWKEEITQVLKVSKYFLSVDQELIRQVGEKIGILIQ